MAMVPKRLAGPLVLTDTAEAIYIAPVDGAFLHTIHVSNPSGSPVDLTVSIGNDTAATRINDDFEITADTVWQDRPNFPLVNGDFVEAFASTTGVLVVELNGKTSTARYSAAGLVYLFGDARAPRP